MKRMKQWLGLMMAVILAAGSVQAPVYAVETGTAAAEAEVEAEGIESVKIAEDEEPEIDLTNEEFSGEEDFADDVIKEESEESVPEDIDTEGYTLYQPSESAPEISYEEPEASTEEVSEESENQDVHYTDEIASQEADAEVVLEKELTSDQIRAFQDKVKIWKNENQITIVYDSTEDIMLSYSLYSEREDELLYEGSLKWDEESGLYYEAVDFDVINEKGQAEDDDFEVINIRDIPVKIVLDDGSSQYDEYVTYDLSGTVIENVDTNTEDEISIEWNPVERADGYSVIVRGADEDGTISLYETADNWFDMATSNADIDSVSVVPFRFDEAFGVNYYGEAVSYSVHDSETEQENGNSAQEEPADEEKDIAEEVVPEEKVTESKNATAVYYGQCGDNVAWTLFNDGTLYVYGTGELIMNNKSYDTGATFFNWKSSDGHICYDEIKEAIIGEGITAIASYAFQDCHNLVSVSMADTVTEIRWSVFSGCENLNTVNFPNSLKIIYNYAFQGCKSLKSLSLPDSLKEIRQFAFKGSGLKSLTIPKDMEVISSSIVEETPLEELYISGDIATWGPAFEYAQSLKTVILAEGLTYIGQGAFRDCTALTEIEIPKSVGTIKNEAFSYCTSLQRVVFRGDAPYFDNSGITAGEYYFSHCELNAYYPADNPTWTSDKLQNYGGTITWKPYYSDVSKCTVTLSNTSIVYNGQAQTPVVNIENGGMEMKAGTDYTVSYSNNINAGTATVTVSGIGKYTGSISKNFTISKATPTLSFASTSVTKKTTDSAFTNTLTKKTDGTVTFKSSNTAVATVNSSSGQVTIKGAGSATITASAAAGTNYKAGSASYSLTVQTATVNISDCTVTVSSGSYVYTGSAIKPSVTVEYGTATLASGTDYSVSYSNNTNAGTATITVTGKGTYTGTVKKTFTISKATPTLSFASTSVTKKTTDSAFTNTLTKKTDGTVTFKSSKTAVATVNSSTGQVTIKGAGTTTITATAAAGTNYNSGSASYTLKVTAVSSNAFQWGRDNWNFNNSDYSGEYDGFTSGQYISQINSSYLNTLKANLTNSEYEYIFDRHYGWIYESWGGSCYGMSSLIHLSQNGFVPYSSYKSGATSLYSLDMPRNNMNISSLITYYQMLQVKEVIQRQYRTVPGKSNRENIGKIVELLNSNKTVLIGYQKAGWGGHAVLAYDVEYGSYTWNGVTYQGCIKICDPNSSRGYNSENNIYFNTNSYNWAIPRYYNSGLMSTKGAVFNYVGSSVSDINTGGYLAGNNSTTVDYVARLDAFDISDNRNITKVKKSNGNYNTVSGGGDDIIEDYSYMMSGSDDGVIGYNLFDADSAYKVTQKNADTLKLRMDYEDCLLSAESAAGNSAIFDKKGYVLMDCDSADYEIGITSNDDYPTDWFTVKVSGTGVNTVSLEKLEDGYLLEADNLSNIKATANNRSEDVEAFASTDEQKALICETNGKLDIRVDRDHNGTYETSVVGEADLKDADVDKITAQKYTGSKITPVPKVTLNGRVLTNGTDYALSYKNNINAGTATVVITGKGSYTGTVTKTFLILPGKTSRGDMFNLANNVKVTWKEVPGAKYYKVYREGITDNKESQIEPVIVTDRLVGWDAQPGLTNGHAYRYKIVASLTGKGDPSGDSTLSYSKVMYRLKTVVIRSVKNTEPGKVTVKYDKTTSGDSYVLQYCEREDMVGAKTKVVLGADNTSYTIGGLKKGKTYYISIRVRKKVDGIDYYTTFGVPKKVAILK